jgi:hypothetical protein
LFDLSHHHPFFLHQFTQVIEMKLFQKTSSFILTSIHPFKKLLHSSLHPFMWLFSSVHHRPPAAEIIERRLFFDKQIFIHPFAPCNSFIHSIHFIRCFSFLIPSSFTSRLLREELSQGRAHTTETQHQGPSSAAVPSPLASSAPPPPPSTTPCPFHALHKPTHSMPVFLHGSSSSSASVLHSLRLNCFFLLI